MFDPHQGISKNKEHHKDFEKRRAERMVSYNHATSHLSLSHYSDKEEMEKQKESLVAPLVDI